MYCRVSPAAFPYSAPKGRKIVAQAKRSAALGKEHPQKTKSPERATQNRGLFFCHAGLDPASSIKNHPDLPVLSKAERVGIQQPIHQSLMTNIQ